MIVTMGDTAVITYEYDDDLSQDDKDWLEFKEDEESAPVKQAPKRKWVLPVIAGSVALAVGTYLMIKRN